MAVFAQNFYCFERLTEPKPKLGPKHERRPETAVSRLDVTTTLISVKLRSVGAPGPDPVVQGGCGCAYRMIPYPLAGTELATAGPEKLSPFLNVADQVPVSAFGACSMSDSCAVPSPELGSLIEPDQLPAGDSADDVGVGEVGVVLPLQPPTLIMTATIKASGRFI